MQEKKKKKKLPSDIYREREVYIEIYVHIYAHTHTSMWVMAKLGCTLLCPGCSTSHKLEHLSHSQPLLSNRRWEAGPLVPQLYNPTWIAAICKLEENDSVSSAWATDGKIPKRRKRSVITHQEALWERWAKVVCFKVTSPFLEKQRHKFTVTLSRVSKQMVTRLL